MSPRDAIRSSLPRYRRARSVKRKKLGELLYRDLANCRTVITNFSGEVMETRVNCMRRAAERQGLLRAGPCQDRHRSRRSDCVLMTTAYHRLQRLPVSHDRPTCRRRRGVEYADAGHPQSDRRPIARAGHANRRRTALPANRHSSPRKYKTDAPRACACVCAYARCA